jgi:hypothetical protein
MFRRTGFGAALSPELAQAMRAEILKTGLPASLFEPIAKGFGRVRFSPRRHQINQVVRVPEHGDHGFRLMAITVSGGWRSLIPFDGIIDSGDRDQVVCEGVGTGTAG